MKDEARFGRRLAGLLSERNRQLDPALRDALAAARRQAVTAARERHAGVFRPHLGRSWWPALKPAMAAALVLVVLFGGDYVNTLRTQAMQGEVETALLADDLPIDAYLDQGFRAWLLADSSASRS
ncbi:DUF3619 family protein [Denitromonas iodatirespirans]|uniref:DUF3619 family protein n=1 Tax=Denitromonas iodatirespirans TaxID=2795389 RepID=A0A944HBL9_DENI1|nr:DUF3619 family protein [Denitromonas iodatirespirans]MBT0960401.1 DUF3619 family protein [Denitromonas iodatirespirans]